MTSSPGLSSPSVVAGMASVQPAVTVTCDFGSIACPVSRSQRVAMACVNSGTPPIGAY